MGTSKRGGLLVENGEGDDIYWEELALPLRWLAILGLWVLTLLVIWLTILTTKGLEWMIG